MSYEPTMLYGLPTRVVLEFLETNPGRNNPYHGNTHSLWTLEQVYNEASRSVSTVERVPLLVAALYHDWGHPGVKSDDRDNVRVASGRVMSVDGIFEHDLKIAARMIQNTVWPLGKDPRTLPMPDQILRDVDIWSMAYVSDAMFYVLQAGLAQEQRVPLVEWFKTNAEFFRQAPTLSFYGREAAQFHRQRLVTLCKTLAGDFDYAHEGA